MYEQYRENQSLGRRWKRREMSRKQRMAAMSGGQSWQLMNRTIVTASVHILMYLLHQDEL